MPEELNLALIILVEVSFVIFIYRKINNWYMEYENRYTETRKHTHTTTKKNKKRKKGTQQKALLDNNNDGYKLEER